MEYTNIQTQGSSVAHTFLSLPEWRVRGISRNPGSPAAQALSTQGVEIVQGDLDDKDSLIPAFIGATVIFSNTDYFTTIFAALGSGDTSTSLSLKKKAFHREVLQNVNAAEAAASPLVLQTLERFVISSLADATKWSGGKLTTVFHFDSKAESIRLIKSRFPELAKRMSMLQLGHYVANWKYGFMGPQKQADGSFLTFRQNAADTKFQFVDTHRDTGGFVRALVEFLPAGKTMAAVSETLTWPEWMRIWGEVNGVKAGFKQVSKEEFWKGIPEPLAEELSDSFDFIEEFGITGGDPDVLTADQVSGYSLKMLGVSFITLIGRF